MPEADDSYLFCVLITILVAESLSRLKSIAESECLGRSDDDWLMMQMSERKLVPGFRPFKHLILTSLFVLT